MALEAAALAVAAGTLVVEIGRGRVQHVGSTVGVVLTFLALAALLGAAARALARRRRWGRAPLAMWQLLQGLVGVSQFAANPLVSVLLVAAAVVVLVGLFTPASLAATDGGEAAVG